MKLIYKSKHIKMHRRKLANRMNKSIGLSRIQSTTLMIHSVECGIITAKQFLSFVQTIQKILKKRGKLILCVLPLKPVTKKPKEVRMGKGKGNVDRWIAKIKKGTIVSKLVTTDTKLALFAYKTALKKLPIKVKIL